MQICFLLYDRFTALDIVGPYEVLSKLPGSEVVFAAERAGAVRADSGRLSLVADAALNDVPTPDIVVVPGGPDLAAQTAPGAVHDWLRKVDRVSTWTTSVCTGSLVLAAAGLLVGRRATAHWLAVDALAAFGAVGAGGRVVFDGKYATAAGVSAGIDLGLALAGRVAGDRVAQTIQLGIEYDPRPPYSAGSPLTAPADVVAFLRTNPHLVMAGGEIADRARA